MLDVKDAYRTLNLNYGASEEEVTKAYRDKARKIHPDKPGGNKEMFQHVNDAYQFLKSEF